MGILDTGGAADTLSTVHGLVPEGGRGEETEKCGRQERGVLDDKNVGKAICTQHVIDIEHQNSVEQGGEVAGEAFVGRGLGVECGSGDEQRGVVQQTNVV